jgi:hypothetical protein
MNFKALGESIVSQIQDVFGSDVEYTPDGGSPVTIKGVFDNAWVEVEGVQSLRPVLRIALSALESAPGKGDQVQIDSTNYRVVESRKDEHGGTSLILKKV